jgi:hypothetical protein
MAIRFVRKLVFVCILTGITALVFQDGDLSSKAAGLIQDRLQELLERTLQF